MSEPAILYVDLAGYQSLPPRDVLKVAGFGAKMQSVTDINAALSIVDSAPKLDILITNAPQIEVMQNTRKKHPNARTILVTDLPMETYSQELGSQEENYLDHVIANRPLNEWTISELRVTIQKILGNDIFGIDKYLASGAHVHQIEVRSSALREQYNNEVMLFAEKCRLSTLTCKTIWGICEELLMNAIYDAPAAAGIQKFFNIPRTTKVDLGPTEAATLQYGCDGKLFALSCTDPFGLMTQEKLFEYVKKVLRRHDSQSIIDTKEGGAGLGLFKILYSSHVLICNVSKNQRSEIMALINVDEQLRDFSKMARSIHFFKGDLSSQ